MKHYLRHTTLFLIALVLFSCGSGDTPVGQGVGQDFSLADSGGIAPKVQWDYRNPFNSPLSKGDRGLSNTIHHKAPLGVYKVRATLLDTSNNPVSGFQTTKDVAPGDSGTITFTSVPAGTYNAKLEGLDSTGSDVLYTGQTNGIGVTANQVAEPSVIARYTRADNASPGSSGHSPANGTTNIPANTKISVQVSDNDAGVDASSIVLTINNEDVTSKSSIIGTSDNYTVLYTPSTNLSGTVTVTLRASDLANPANSMSTETWSFTIASGGTTDTTAPSSPSISFSNTTTSSQLATAAISATDDTGVTGYYLSESSTTPSITSSGWTSVTSSKSYSSNVNWTLSSGNGSKTVYVWFKDAVGNISSSTSATITLNQTDTTAPTNPSISINSGSSSTTSTSVTLTLSASDDTGVTGYYVSESTITPSLTSANWVSVTSAASYSATAAFTLSGGSVGDNTKTVYVWFKDSAGNISASASDSITLTISDSTAPSSPSVSIDSGSSSTTTTSVTLTLSATDNVGVTGYYASETSTTPSASASGWTSVTSTTSYSATVAFTLSSGSVGDNTKTVYVWFKDSAGNISASASDSITLTISDSTAPSSPSVSIDSDAVSTTNTSVTLTLSATDNVGVTGYCAKESSTTPSSNDTCWTSVTSTTSYSGSVSFTLSSGFGTKTVYVWFKDVAGNVSASSSDSITYSPVTDVDNNVYNTVTIGTQIWFKENLKVTRYRNGDAIGTTTPATKDISGETSPKYQWAYNGDEGNVATYGRLYTWYAATDSRGLCPTGWHLPTDAEWTTLTDYLGGESVAGGKMKEAGTTHWNSPNTSADNSSGFTALPGGFRYFSGSFYDIGSYGLWWSATEYDAPYAWYRNLDYRFGSAYRNFNYKYDGFSVRCVRD